METSASKDEILPLLMNAMDHGNLSEFEDLLNLGFIFPAYPYTSGSSPGLLSPSIIYPGIFLNEHSIYGYLRAKYQGDTLFNLAVNRDKMQFFACLLKHAYFQGIYLSENISFSPEDDLVKNIHAIYTSAFKKTQSKFSSFFITHQEKQKFLIICQLHAYYGEMQEIVDELHGGTFRDFSTSLVGFLRLRRTAMKDRAKLIAMLDSSIPVLPFTLSNLQAICKGRFVKIPILERAITEGNLPLVKELHSLGLNLNSNSMSFKSPLYIAVCRSQPIILKWLIANGACYDEEAFDQAKINSEESLYHREENNQIFKIMQEFRRSYQTNIGWKMFLLLMFLSADRRLVVSESETVLSLDDDEILLARLRPKVYSEFDPGIHAVSLLGIAHFLGIKSPDITDFSKMEALAKRLKAIKQPSETALLVSAPSTLLTAMGHFKPGEQKQRKIFFNKPAEENLEILRTCYACTERQQVVECLRSLKNLIKIATDKAEKGQHVIILEHRTLITNVVKRLKALKHFEGKFPFPNPIIFSSSGDNSFRI